MRTTSAARVAACVATCFWGLSQDFPVRPGEGCGATLGPPGTTCHLNHLETPVVGWCLEPEGWFTHLPTNWQPICIGCPKHVSPIRSYRMLKGLTSCVRCCAFRTFGEELQNPMANRPVRTALLGHHRSRDAPGAETNGMRLLAMVCLSIAPQRTSHFEVKGCPFTRHLTVGSGRKAPDMLQHTM